MNHLRERANAPRVLVLHNDGAVANEFIRRGLVDQQILLDQYVLDFVLYVSLRLFMQYIYIIFTQNREILMPEFWFFK